MSKKYIKNEKGIVRAVTSDNLQLEKPLLNENYDIEVHNRNMDKIDGAIQEVKGKIDGLELVASNVKMTDGTTVEEAVLNNNYLSNQALNKANEAFQRGDNVKTQLVDKLISEGLEVSTNNTFEELISGIALGKKWASGIVTPSSQGSSFTMASGATRSFVYIEIPKLDFDASLIVATSQYSSNTNYISVLSTTDTQILKPNIVLGYFPSSYSGSTSGGTFKVDSNVIVDNGYRIPVCASYATTWIAFE